MSASVKRPYDNEGRRAQSDANRRRVLEVARELMMTKGYRATTIAAIARQADVHVDTIYALVGRKPEILGQLIELAISGADTPLVPEERDYVHRMHDEPDPVERLRIYAAAVRAIQVRMAPLLVALRDASSTEPEAKAVWQQISDRRAGNMRLLVSDMGDGVLRDGLSIEDAADAIWATASSELFVLLTDERGWSIDHYEQWLHDSWCRLLLTSW